MTLLDERLDAHLDPRPEVVPVSLARRAGRWRTSARLARREMRRRPSRTVLAVLLIAVPVAAMVCADVAYRGDRLPPDRGLTYGAADARAILGADAADARDEIVAQLPTGTRSLWSEFVYAPLRSVADPGTLVDTTVVRRNAGDPLTEGMVRRLEGRLPVAADEVVLDPSLATAFGVGVGDLLSLVRPSQTFTVVGIGEMRAGWGGSPPVFLAPGFDLSAIRPEVISYELLVQGPAFVVPGDIAANDGFVQLPGIEYLPGVEYRVPESLNPPGESPGASAVGTVFFDVPFNASAPPEELLLGWILGLMLMGVLGIVVAVAFAVSGRRQLVTIGQLSATGADPSVIRRFLGLQGTWTGLVGATLGVAGGLAAVWWQRGWFDNDGRWALHPGDWLVVGLTAVGVATVAAMVPTRALVHLSVLAALGGRRPVAAVRGRQLAIGTALAAGGLAVLFLSIIAARESNDSGSDVVVPAIIAALGGFSLLAGVCCLCPVAIDTIARLGVRRRGVAMLATRSLGRHRARAAALLAAIVTVGAAATAVAAAGEGEIVAQRNNEARFEVQSSDVIHLRSYGFDDTMDAPVLQDPEVVDPTIRSAVESVVGEVTWVRADSLIVDPRSGDVGFVATDEVLTLMGLTIEQRAAVAAFDVVRLGPDPEAFEQQFLDETLPSSIPPGEVHNVVVPGLAFGYLSVLVAVDALPRFGLEPTVPTWFGRADHLLTRAEVDRIYETQSFERESPVFSELERNTQWVTIDIRCCDSIERWVVWVRVGTIGGTLLLMSIIVGLGMALWAAEGREERDTLVAVGAGPSTLAAIAGLKAWLLVFAGALLAVPLGFGTLWLALHAAQERATFPRVFVAVLVVALPLVIGGVTWSASALAQRIRPVRASTATAD